MGLGSGKMEKKERRKRRKDEENRKERTRNSPIENTTDVALVKSEN